MRLRPEILPRLAYRRLRGYIVIPFVLVTLASVLALGSLEFRSWFDPIMPQNDPYMRRLREVEATFGAQGMILGAVEVGETIDDAELARIDRLTRVGAAVEGGSVVSPTNLHDLFLEGDTLVERRLYDPDAASQEVLRTRLLGTPLFRKLFVSADGRALLLYFIPAGNADALEYAAHLLSTLPGDDIRLFGDAVLKHVATTTAMSELLMIGLVALALVFVIESIITRSLGGGLLLTSVSLVPALWTLGLFALVGTPVSVSTIPVPIIVLVLATSYGIHVHRHVAASGFRVERALGPVTGVVAAAAFTTFVGFLSLTVVPSAFLREVGWFIALGTIEAMLCALFLLPRLLGWWVARHKFSAAPDRLHLAGLSSRSPALRLTILGVVATLLVLGFPNIRARQSSRDAFRPSHPISRTVHYFQERTNADHELELIVDTGHEHGLVEPQFFDSVGRLQEQLAREDTSVHSVSYVDFVTWFLGRHDGRLEPISPQTDAEIGEAMELLSGRETVLGLESLADASWREARIVLWAPVATRQERLRPALVGRAGDPEGGSILDTIEAEARRLLSTERIELVGLPVESVRQTAYLVRSQVLSLVLFGAFLVVFLLAVFRSLRWALTATLPTAVGVVVYYGLLGWLGLLNDPTHVIMICALLGVSNDDVLYFLIVYRRERAARGHDEAFAETIHRTGVPIVQTTGIIAAGVAVFYASALRYLGEAAFVLTAGLFAATATTLFVVPAILSWLPRPIRRVGSSTGRDS
ncbi:MAG: efflux RND transporter permease subunit [Spirochaetota bacterium]